MVHILVLYQNKCHYGMRPGQIFLSLFRFVENISNIYISK